MDRPLAGPKPAIRLPEGAIDAHIHMFMPGFAARPGGPPLPMGATGPDEYRELMKWLGISRVVIVQGNAHQTDNDNLVACLEEMGSVARGVAAIDGSTSDGELARLHDAGVRGTRIMDLPGGGVGLSALEAVDAQAKRLGWALAVQFDGTHLLDQAPRLQALKSDYVIDHHGKFFAGIRPDGPEVAELKRLIDRGNCWFKFAGCYESSLTGGPDFADIGSVAREITGHAPERIVWGTNWPHNMARTPEDYPDDGALLDTVLGWFDGDEARQLALIDNPAQLFGFPRN